MLDIALAILRIALGLILAGHGAQKLFGWFGGQGLAGTGSFLASLRVRGARTTAFLVGLAELLGGLALALGLATPIAAAAIVSVMLGAMALAHWPRFWASGGGIEYPLVVAAAATQLGLAGPGGFSLDSVIGTPAFLPTESTFLWSLLVGLVVVLGLLVARKPEVVSENVERRRDDKLSMAA